jgi:hypothetical protein
VTSVIVCKSYSVFIEKTSDFCLLVSSHFTLRLSCAVSVRTEVSPDFDPVSSLSIGFHETSVIVLLC